MNNLNDILGKIRTLETKLQTFLVSRETAQNVLIPAREYMECYKSIFHLLLSAKSFLVLSLTNSSINIVNKSKTLS